MRRFLLRLIGLLGHLAVAVFVVAVLSAGFWLPVNDPPVNADAIVILGGSYTRAGYAAELYQKGFAPLVFVPRVYRNHGERLADGLGVGLPREEDISHRILEIKGVPARAIRLFGRDSVSTWEETQALQQALGPELKNLLVVTSAYHARRTKMIFKDLLPYRDIRVLSTPYDPYPKAWWRQKDAAANTVLETAKLAYYLLGGRFLGKSDSLGSGPAETNSSPELPSAL